MPNTDNRRYKILEQGTTGYSVINDAVDLTREECDKKLDELVYLGANPNTLKVVLNDDERYPSPTDPGYFPIE
tara:strand:- start:55 stop:273 length:219 start_codon:yes stop_codon:yes gene_type:complete